MDYAYANEDFFGHVDYNTQQAIGEFLQSEKLRDKIIKRKEEKGEYNMCKALDDLYQEGIDKGYERGHSEGRMEHLMLQIKKKLEKNLSVDEIAEVLEEDADTIKELIEKLKNE